MNPILAMVLSMTLSLGVGVDVVETEDGYLVSRDGMAHIMAYIDELETRVNVLEEYVEEQEVYISLITAQNEDLINQLNEDNCEFWRVTTYITSGALVAVILYGMLR